MNDRILMVISRYTPYAFKSLKEIFKKLNSFDDVLLVIGMSQKFSLSLECCTNELLEFRNKNA